ncbi:MAG TPA: hypothetical protein VIM56_06240 [Rhizomicrobium sp.]
MSILKWASPKYTGDRHLAMCGEISVGAVFPPIGGKYWRWRCWIGETTYPAEGSEKNEILAKGAVELRFARFLDLAGLTPMAGTGTA